MLFFLEEFDCGDVQIQLRGKFLTVTPQFAPTIVLEESL